MLCMLPCLERIGSFKYLGFEFWKGKFFPPPPLLGGGGWKGRFFARTILKRIGGHVQLSMMICIKYSSRTK